jgi:Flp pilus assembly protein TadB
MPIGPQPKGAQGTAGHPYSALNLRLALASFGLAFLAVLAAILFAVGYPIPAGIAVVLAVVTIVDIVVIQSRRRQRRRRDHQSGSLFE